MKYIMEQHGIIEETYSSDHKVRKYYSWRASNYDAGAGFEVEHHAEALRLAEVQEGDHVLDAAWGTGRGAVSLAKAIGLRGSEKGDGSYFQFFSYN